MYSRNALLNALHIKSDKYLGVNLDRYALTFHSDKEVSNKNPEHEIPFSKVKSLEADVTHADSGKYYLKVHTEEGDLKFKFKNARDFHSVVEALRNTIHGDKPFYNVSESYNAEAKKYNEKPGVVRKEDLNDSVSSDDMKEYQNVSSKHKDLEKMNKASYSLKKDEIEGNYTNFDEQKKREDEMHKARIADAQDLNKDLKKDSLDQQKENYKLNKEVINEQRYDPSTAKDMNKEQFKTTKEDIKDSYDSKKDIIDQGYKVNKNVDKDMAKDVYKADKDSIKKEKDVNLAYNKEQYNSNKDSIKESQKLSKDRVEDAKDRNDVAYEHAKSNIKSDAERTKENLDADYKMHKEGTAAERDIAKDNMKTDLREAKADLKSDVRDAKDIKEARY